MKVFEAIAAEFLNQGITTASTLMSEEIAWLVAELERNHISLLHTRHEATAIGIAHGYAQAAGSIGVAIVGRGPALTNALTPIVNAAKDGVGARLLVIAGDSPVRDPSSAPESSHHKFLSQSALLAAVGVSSVVLSSAESARADFQTACAYARSGGVVVVNLPRNVAAADAGDAGTRVHLVPLTNAPVPDGQAIVAAADLLEESWAVKRPLILAGRGAVAAGALPELERLGDRIGALLATTMPAKSLFRGSPFDIGVFGTLGEPVAQELAAEADLLLVFGAQLSPHTTWNGQGLSRTRVIQFDSRPPAFGRHRPVDIAVCADAKLGAAALEAELAKRGHSALGFRIAGMAERVASLRRKPSFKERSAVGFADTRVLLQRIDAALSQERAVVLDGGHNATFFMAELSVPDAESIFYPHGFGGLEGQAFAMGVALARPERLTIHAGGDGSFMMALNSLDTAVRYGLRMVFIVCNDAGFGAEAHLLEWGGVSGDVARYHNPSLENVARALGADGLTIRSLEDVGRLQARAAHLERPLIVDCLVDPQLKADWWQMWMAVRPDT